VNTTIQLPEEKRKHYGALSGIALAIAVTACVGLANFDRPVRALGLGLPFGLTAGIFLARGEQRRR
jgi:hypothetical protein